MVIWDGAFPSVDPIEISDAAMHASLSFDSVASSGPPARPLEFPAPSVHRGARCSTVALDHRTGRIYPIKNVLMRVSGSPQRAFLIKKTISKSVYGVIRLCVVLKRRKTPDKDTEPPSGRRRRSYGVIRDEDAEWESTEALAVVKVRFKGRGEFAFFGRDDQHVGLLCMCRMDFFQPLILCLMFFVVLDI